MGDGERRYVSRIPRRTFVIDTGVCRYHWRVIAEDRINPSCCGSSGTATGDRVKDPAGVPDVPEGSAGSMDQRSVTPRPAGEPGTYLPAATAAVQPARDANGGTAREEDDNLPAPTQSNPEGNEGQPSQPQRDDEPVNE